MIHATTRLFPLWAILASLLAWAWPAPFVALKPAIPWLLALIMFSMGLTLRPENFAEALRRPGLIGLGLLLQFSVMPLLAWLIGGWLGLSSGLLAGLVLVGASPGGTASNVITFLARGDVALSITLTACSTLLAVVATPGLTLLYAGHAVEVPAWAMLRSVALIVLLPVLGGVFLNTLFGRWLGGLKPALPLVAVIAICTIIGIVVGLNAGRITRIGAALALAVVLHNAGGLLLGYLVPRLLGQPPRIARTLAIETGMQNSGLAVALAVKYFGPAAALPGALFSLWHNLSGALLASLWRRGR